MGIQELADDYETSPAVRGVILSALGIGKPDRRRNTIVGGNPAKLIKMIE